MKPYKRLKNRPSSFLKDELEISYEYLTPYEKFMKKMRKLASLGAQIVRRD